MIFTWDEYKRQVNFEKHGLDFADFEAMFDFDTAVSAPAGARRVKLVGVWGDLLLVATIVAPLGTEAVAIISLRRASRAERRAYEETTP